MKKLIAYCSMVLLVFLPNLTHAQCQTHVSTNTPLGSWQITPALGDAHEITNLEDSPATTTFGEMLGINANTEWDQIYSNDCSSGDNPYNPLMKNVRSFHLSVKDYSVDVSDCGGMNGIDCSEYEDECTTYNNSIHICTPADRGADGPLTGLCWNGGMDGYKFRYNEWNGDWEINCDAVNHCDNPTYCSTSALTLSAALIVGPINSEDKVVDSIFNSMHDFPTGWWTAAEWGANLTEVHCNAYAYAEAFITTMCPDGNCLVDILEIGNEPWGYVYDANSALNYEPLYEAISRGMVDAFIAKFGNNPQQWPMKLLPASFQARYEDNDPNASWNNYMGRRIPHYLAPYYDGINIHPYSLIEGTENWTYPEDPNSEFQSIANAVAFRNTNMPNQKIYASEFGWDSDPQLNGVGLAAQAAYIIRGIAMMSRSGVERSILFNSNDGPAWAPILFKTAGLFETEPYENCNNDDDDDVNYFAKPKQSYTAIEELVEELGSARHFGVLEETAGTNGVYAYLLGDADGPTHVLAWRPIEISPDGSNAYTHISKTIALPSQYNFEVIENESIWLDGLTNNYPGYPQISNGNLILNVVAATPVLIPLKEEGDCDLTFSGRIYTMCDGQEDQAVPNVTVELEGGGPFGMTTTTDENGYYEFTDVCPGGNFTITPSFKENDKCGITMNDVSIIHDYLLGWTTELSSSPYKMIAGDVSANQNIDLADPYILEEYIEGGPLVPDFYSFGGEHWIFVDRTFNFPNPTNPFMTTFPQILSFNGPLVDQLNQDFVGVKVGDVDCSYVPACDVEQLRCPVVSDGCEDAEEQNNGNTNTYGGDLDLGQQLVGLVFNNVNIPSEATVVEAHITFTGASAAGGGQLCQFSIRGEANGSDDCFEDAPNNISSRPTTNENVTWNIGNSWQTGGTYESADITSVIQEIIDSPSFGPNSPIILMIDGTTGHREAVSFNGDPANAPELCITFKPGSESGLRNDGKISKKENRLPTVDRLITKVSNYPNPFSDHTNVSFYLREDVEVSLNVYNVLGQKIHQQKRFMTAGEQQMEIEISTIETNSLLYYTLETSTERVGGKMIYLKR